MALARLARSNFMFLLGDGGGIIPGLG